MDAEILGAFAECDEIKGTLALVGRRIDRASDKHAEMRGELALKIHQIEALDAQCIEMRGTLAPLGQQVEESEAEIVEIKVSLALKHQQLAEAHAERNGVRADLALKTRQLAESTVERNQARADLLLLTQRLAESTVERNGARADLAVRTQQLVESNIELERFAYISAHDLQEPVRTVVSFSQLLQRHLGDGLDDEGRDYLGFIVTGARRMGDQVRALTSYLLMPGDQTSTVAVDLEAVVRDACNDLRNPIEARGVSLEIGALPTVDGDRVLLTELFQNLIANAIKYTPPDSPPRINISACRVDDLWRVAVRDEGIGVAPEYHQRIFNIFERLNTGSANSGTGIGLAICKGIVERLGGKIWVESEVGKGATFLFTLRNAPSAV